MANNGRKVVKMFPYKQKKSFVLKQLLTKMYDKSVWKIYVTLVINSKFGSEFFLKQRNFFNIRNFFDGTGNSVQD